MNKIKSDRKSKRNNTVKVFLAVAFVLLLSFALYAVLFSFIASKRYTKSIKIAADTIELSTSETPKELRDLEKQIAFLQAKLQLAGEDSVSLVINLADSLVTLEQKGVILHTAKISFFNSSKIFDHIDQDVLRKIFTTPLKVHQSFSTIPKIKYQIKVAPSDTSQINPLAMPDSIYSDTVCFCFYLDYGICLVVTQLDDQSLCKNFLEKIKRERSKHILSDLIRLNIPEFRPVIHIKLQQTDVRSIYRSLPVNARIAITM